MIKRIERSEISVGVEIGKGDLVRQSAGEKERVDPRCPLMMIAKEKNRRLLELTEM